MAVLIPTMVFHALLTVLCIHAAWLGIYPEGVHPIFSILVIVAMTLFNGSFWINYFRGNIKE